MRVNSIAVRLFSFFLLVSSFGCVADAGCEPVNRRTPASIAASLDSNELIFEKVSIGTKQVKTFEIYNGTGSYNQAPLLVDKFLLFGNSDEAFSFTTSRKPPVLLQSGQWDRILFTVTFLPKSERQYTAYLRIYCSDAANLIDGEYFEIVFSNKK